VNITFHESAFKDYQNWALEDSKVFARLAGLITEITRTPFTGTGKPEPLRGKLSGYWSRRITQEHRLVYKVSADQVTIASCKYHY
jgi:toxin YoeB